MPTISVAIPITNFWPSSDELSARDGIMAALDALAFGSPIGCGGGRGAVDFSYRIADATGAPTLFSVSFENIFRQQIPRFTLRNDNSRRA